MLQLAKLPRKLVAKPWGRTDIAACFDAGDAKIGEIWFDAIEQSLPILVKWLFTSERLSIQVHPNDAQAYAAGFSGGKEECWIVTDVTPGATLGLGTIRPLSAAELASAALSGELEDLIDWRPVQPGDWFHIPPGTVHAIGAGVTLVEIQQNSDVTYRLYDYGRPRPLHLEAGVAVSTPRPYADLRCGRLQRAGPLQSLASCDHFKIFYGEADSYHQLSEQNIWLIPLTGQCRFGTLTAYQGDVLYGVMPSAGTPSADFTFLAAIAQTKSDQVSPILFSKD